MMDLYEVQKEAIIQSKGRKKFGFFLEQGLGKTALTIADYERLRIDQPELSMVVICPNSLKTTWKEEVDKWDCNVPVTLWPDRVIDRPFILVMNYEALIGSGGDYLENLMNFRIMLVVDESIHIKNPKAQRTKCLLYYAKKAEYIRLLSGAPIVNNAMDAWAQLFMLDAKVNSNPYAFRNKYCIMGGYMNKQIIGAMNEDTLTKRMNEVGFIAKKKDWTDLPDKLYTRREFDHGAAVAKHYGQMRKDLVTAIEDDVISADMVLVQLGKLQQISSGFIMNEDAKAINIIEPGKNRKIKLLFEIIEEIPSKILIFCRFKQSIKNIIEVLSDKTILYTALTGGMSLDEIKTHKDQFNEGQAKLMVCQVQAAMYGHTLLGPEDNPCHNTVFFENDYNLNARIQAEDRNHRFGQKFPVTYHDLIGSDMDRVILNALSKKLSIAEAIVKDIK